MLARMVCPASTSRRTDADTRLPKPVIAMVNGYAIGGGHVLHVVCGSHHCLPRTPYLRTDRAQSEFRRWSRCQLPRTHIVGQKKARRYVVPLKRQYSAKEAEQMGLSTRLYLSTSIRRMRPCTVWHHHGTFSAGHPHDEGVGFNAELDGQAGIRELSR